MKAFTLFSGIGGFDLAFERAGIEVDSVCEIDKNAQNILRRHFPNSKLYDDVRKVGNKTHEKRTVDIIAGGFPCQDLSIAGKRKGLDGERSGLWFEFARIIDELEPGWVVIENVPGLLSSAGGRDFAVILQWLAQRGYCVAWRVLDAQYFGVAQRRRRVFVVASFGNGRAAEVLFEREGFAGNTPPSRETGKEVADTFTIRSGKDGGGKGYLGAESLPMTLGGQQQYLAKTITTREAQSMDSETMNFIVSQAYNIQQNDNGSHKRKDRPEGGMYVNETDTSLTVGTTDQTLVASTITTEEGLRSPRGDGNDNLITAWEMSHASEAYRESGSVAPTLQARMGTGGNNVPMVGVRRLTPLECERLQGFTSTKETITIDVCLDHQKNSASVEIQSRRSQKHAESAGKIDSSESAPFVEMNINTNDQPTSKLAQPSVLINCGERKVEILSQGKLLFSASFAEDKNLFPLFTQSEDFALLLAGLNTILAQITHHGAEALHPKEQSLIHLKDGLSAARLSGNEIMQLVKNAESDTVINKKLLKSIISDPLNLKIVDTTLTILSYSVIHAISGYIPEEILKSNSFRVEINTDFGHTFGQSDSARYKQLGNAVAVPVVEWIAKRIMTATAENG